MNSNWFCIAQINIQKSAETIEYFKKKSSELLLLLLLKFSKHVLYDKIRVQHFKEEMIFMKNIAMSTNKKMSS